MPEGSVNDVLLKIANWQIPTIPGEFAEDTEGKSQKEQDAAEARRSIADRPPVAGELLQETGDEWTNSCDPTGRSLRCVAPQLR